MMNLAETRSPLVLEAHRHPRPAKRTGRVCAGVSALLIAAGCATGGSDAGRGDGQVAAGRGEVDLIAPSPKTVGPNGEQAQPSADIVLTDEDLAALKRLEPPKAGVLWPASFQFYKVASEGIRSELGKVDGKVIAETDSGYDPAVQANDVENVMAQDPDIIFTWLVDPVQGAQAFRPAAEAGVELSFMSNLPNGFEHPEDYVGVVTDDLYGMGQAAAEMMADALGGSGQIGFVYHDADAFVTNQRDQAFKETIENEFPDIEIVAEGGFAEPDQAYNVANDMVLQHPDLDGIYAAWAVPANSVVEALRANDKPDVKVITLDLDPTVAVDMASGGNVAGIVADVPHEIGRAMAVEALWGLIGKKAPPFVIVPTMKVTRDNLITAWNESLKEDPPQEVLDALGN
ncbi:MAG: substrate-binding domain-containing protein [Actinomycetota bacterium]|nr:substrate-binding domain-containing protein [Actinomycetota bacterium]